MYLADYHTHSSMSPDAMVPMEGMARAALAAGMDEICFTDHVDFAPSWGGWKKTRSIFAWEDLTDAFRRAEEALGGAIRMRLGIEIGDPFCNIQRAEAVLSAAPELDFSIGSIHVLSEKLGWADLSKLRPADEAEAVAAMEDYLVLARQLAEWGQFTVMGHLTLPLRYLNERCGFSLTYDGYEAEIEGILRALLKNGCGIELNTNRGHTPLPDEKWLRMYRDLGGEIITLGTDAHSEQYVGFAIREGQDLLRRCGFTRFCTFEKQQPIWHAL